VTQSGFHALVIGPRSNSRSLPPVVLKAGDVLCIPYETVHSAKNVGSVNAAELATYIVEKGKPLLTLVK
jgi:quercetin dioxygenase-like cupin family protein